MVGVELRERYRALIDRARASPLPQKAIAALALALLPLGILVYASASASYAELQAGRERLVSARFELLRQTASFRLGRVLGDLESLAGRQAGGIDEDRLCELVRARAEQAGVAAVVSLDPGGGVRCGGGQGVPPPAIVRLTRAIPIASEARFINLAVVDPNGEGVWVASRDVGARALGGAIAARLSPANLNRLIDRAAMNPRDEVRLAVAGRVVSSASILAWSDSTSRREALRHGRLDPWDNVSISLIAPLPDVRVSQAIGVALPALMWLAALAVAWVLVNRLVVGPVSDIQAVVDRYAEGDDTARIGGENLGSRELVGLAHAFDTMADKIAGQGHAMEAALVTEKALTREVHHRVKNNLQIVSSLISIQARDVTIPEVAEAYALIRSRVNALALVHRWMYQEGGAPGVDLRALIADLCANLEHGTDGRAGGRLHVSSSVERLTLGQDTALPIAFLITELVSGVAKNATGPADARVEAKLIGGRAMLRVLSDTFDGPDGFAGFEEGSRRIVAGLARQMRSPLTYDAAYHCFAIEFPVQKVP